MTRQTAPSLLESAGRESDAPTTLDLARFVVESRFDAIGDAVRREARRSLVNWVACSVGGAGHHTVAIALDAVRALGGPGPATLLGRTERLSFGDAALINGISSAVLDYDSTQAKFTNIHPSGPVLPALVAVAETRRVSGANFLHAYILGVEIACRLANSLFNRDNPGWHVTGVCGGIGAAAAVGRLIGLDAAQMVHALGIAATQAGGLREMYGTMCKSFTPGRAAQNGLLAATLASRGFSGAQYPLEGKTGFARVLGGRPLPASVLDGLGTAFEIMANTYKPFACAIVTHAVIDGCLRLRGQHRFRPEQITQVLLTVAPVALALAGNPHPRTGLESKFSLHHAAALALTNGRVSHHDFADATAADAGLASLRATVTARTDTGFAKDQAVVTLHLDDGRILMQAVEHALGGIGHPMSDADLDAKFHDLVDAPLGRAGADALLASCWGVEALEDVAELAAAAVPRPDVAA